MHIASMTLGIFDWLVGWIADFAGTVLGWVFDIIMQIANRALFSLAKNILFIVDWIQSLFRRLAGLDKYWVLEGGKEVERGGDMLISLITDQSVLQVVLALTLVAMAMVIIATIIKVIQSEFSSDGKNSKGGIIGDAIKSFLKFALVPLLCVGGVVLSNVLLQTLDRATNGGASEQNMASQIFVSASSSANKARLGRLNSQGVKDWLGSLYVENNMELTAANIDNMFRLQLSYDSAPPKNAEGIVDTIINSIFDFASGAGIGFINGSAAAIQNTASYQNMYFVSTFYDIGQMNSIILIGGALVACYVMIVTCFGLVMRLFKAVVLFMISPPVVAITPLDKGNAFQSWRKQFVSEVLGAYGAVIGLNLFFLVLPLINNINVFPGSGLGGTTVGGMGGSIYNDMAHLLFTLVGLYMVKDLIKIVTGISGGSDAMGAGEGMAKKAVGTALKVGMAAATGGASLASGIGSKIAAGKASKATGIADQLKKDAITSAGGLVDADGNIKKGYVKKDGTLSKRARNAGVTDANLNDFNTKMAESKAKASEAQGLSSIAETRSTRAKGMFGNLAAEGMGRISKSINGMFGTKLNEEITMDGRSEERKKRAEGAAKRILDGKGTGMDYATLGHSEKVKEVADGRKRVLQETAIDSNALKGSVSAMRAIKLDNVDDLGNAIATAMSHMDNASEGEQSQQIWRGMYEQLKEIAQIKNSGDTATASAMLAQLNTNRAASADKLAKLDVQNDIQLSVYNELKNQNSVTLSQIEDSIKKHAEAKGLSDTDRDSMVAKITEKMKTELDKIAPK